jgi:hypothetical protein
MSLLFTQEWNVVRGLEDDYLKFITDSYIPRSDKLGLTSVGGFYVMSGHGASIISIKSVDSMQTLTQALSSQEFNSIKEDLKQLVSHYGSRILVQNRNIGPEKYSIQKGVWKFNLYFDIRGGEQAQYNDFMTKEFIPEIESFDYVEFTREWSVLIGGTSEILLELSFEDPVDIGRFMGSEAYRDLSYKLSQFYTQNFKSRILRTTERFDEPKWFKL